MRRLAAAALLLCGCVFHREGLPSTDLSLPVDGTDGGSFDLAADASPSDQTAGADRRGPDGPRPDLRPRDKSSIVDRRPPAPITTAALGAMFGSTTVPCIKADGSTQGSPIAIADDSNVFFADGKVTLAGAGADTVSWVGGASSVIVVWNPNACDPIEDPAGYADWGSGGLLVRKASLQNGMLLLQPGLTVQDMDAMNVNSDGTFQVEYFGADDSQLGSFPQLVQPITRAKELILLLGNP